MIVRIIKIIIEIMITIIAIIMGMRKKNKKIVIIKEEVRQRIKTLKELGIEDYQMIVNPKVEDLNSSVIVPNSVQDLIAEGRFKIIRSKISVGIPSGEGKTWLVKIFPDIFIDHDDYLTQDIEDETDTETKNQKLNQMVISDEKILLTWNSKTNPQNREYIGSFLLKYPTRIRKSMDNRTELINENKIIKMLPDIETRNEYIIEFLINNAYIEFIK